MRKRINEIYYFILLFTRVIIFVPAFFLFANKFNDFYTFYNLVELNEQFGKQYLIVFVATILLLALNSLSLAHKILTHKKENLIWSIILSVLSLLLAGYSIYSFKIINFNYAILILLYLVNFSFSLILILIPLFIKTEHDSYAFKSICKSEINEGMGDIDLEDAFYPEVKSELNIFNYQVISLKYAQHLNYPKVRKTIIEDFQELCCDSIESIDYEKILQTYSISEEYLIKTIKQKNKKKFNNIEERINKFNSDIVEYNQLFSIYYKKFIERANEYLVLDKLLQKFLTAFKDIKDFGSKRLKNITEDLDSKITKFAADLNNFLEAYNKIVPNTKIEPFEAIDLFKKIDDVVNLKITDANIADISTSIAYLQDIVNKHSQITAMLEGKIKGLPLNDEKAVYDYYDFKYNDISKIEELFLYLKKNRILYKQKIQDSESIRTIAEIILDDQDSTVEVLFDLVSNEIEVDEYIRYYCQITKDLEESKTNNLYLAICSLKENNFKDANNHLNKQIIKKIIEYKDVNGNNFLHFYPIDKEENAIKDILADYPELIPLLYEPNNLGLLPYDNKNFFNYFNEHDNPYPVSYENVFKNISEKKKIEVASAYIQYKLDRFAMDKKAEDGYKKDLRKLANKETNTIDEICKNYFDDFCKKFDITTYNRLIKHINSLVIKIDAQTVFEYVKKVLCEMDVDTISDCNNLLCCLTRTSLSRNTEDVLKIENKNLYSGQANTFSSAIVLNNLKMLKDQKNDDFKVKNQLDSLLTYYLDFTKKLYLITQHRVAYKYITEVDPTFEQNNNENDGLCQMLGIPNGSSVSEIKKAYNRKLHKARISGNTEEEKKLHAYQTRINKLKG